MLCLQWPCSLVYLLVRKWMWTCVWLFVRVCVCLPTFTCGLALAALQHLGLYYITVHAAMCWWMCVFVCILCRQRAIEQLEAKHSDVRKELVTVKEALSQVTLQRDVLEDEKSSLEQALSKVLCTNTHTFTRTQSICGTWDAFFCGLRLLLDLLLLGLGLISDFIFIVLAKHCCSQTSHRAFWKVFAWVSQNHCRCKEILLTETLFVKVAWMKKKKKSIT